MTTHPTPADSDHLAPISADSDHLALTPADSDLGLAGFARDAAGSEVPPVGGDVGVRLGPVAEIPLGEGRAYLVGDTQMAVFRLRSGDLRAVSAICPHAGGPLADGQIDEQVVICPLHLNVFDLNTGCSSTAQLTLSTYQVEDVEGWIMLRNPPI